MRPSHFEVRGGKVSSRTDQNDALSDLQLQARMVSQGLQAMVELLQCAEQAPLLRARGLHYLLQPLADQAQQTEALAGALLAAVEAGRG
jgi:glycine/D-amino acid oxidase-like deaminating enzyme